MIITLKASSFQSGSQIFWCFGVGNWSIILFSRIINVIILKQLESEIRKKEIILIVAIFQIIFLVTFWYKKLLIQNWNFCPCQQRNKSTSSSRQPDGLIIMYFSCLRELSCFAFFYRQPLRFSLDALSLNNINKLIETPRYRCCAKYIPQLESFFWLIEIGEVVACVCAFEKLSTNQVSLSNKRKLCSLRWVERMCSPFYQPDMESIFSVTILSFH